LEGDSAVERFSDPGITLPPAGSPIAVDSKVRDLFRNIWTAGTNAIRGPDRKGVLVGGRDALALYVPF